MATERDGKTASELHTACKDDGIASCDDSKLHHIYTIANIRIVEADIRCIRETR